MINYLRIPTYVATLLCLFFSSVHQTFAQQAQKKYSISGIVSQQNSSTKTYAILPFASISVSTYGLNAATDLNGKFKIDNVPAGKVKISLHHLGKVSIDTLIDVSQNLNLNLVMQAADFRLKEVVVTSVSNKGATGTSSRIDRTAIDHLQANNLADIMSLLPGGIAVNPTMSGSKQLNIRNVSSSSSASSDANAFGTSILLNGAPMSNNANLQALSPTASGGTGALTAGASAGGGFDVRNISMDNVESVEIIRGIPGVEYGDVTSGVVIVNTKAGHQPLKINAKNNPNIYQVSATKGTNLGGKKGALNLGFDYAHNVNDIVQSYNTYDRFTGTALYSNVFFNKLRSNTSFDLMYGKDTRRLNPDDQTLKTSSKGENLGFIFNTNGNLRIENSWLKNLNYVARVGYTVKNSFYETQYAAANAPYSMTTTDGAVLSNQPGQSIFDTEGNPLTNFGAADQGNYAVYLPSTYVGRYDINGREFNTYLKTVATFFNKIGNTNNKWLIGADFKSDKNFGDGKTFSSTLPPAGASQDNTSYRPRVYKNIPAVNQFGLFAEDKFNTNIAGRNLEILAGLRFDHFSGNRTTLSPRINASLEIFPGVLSLNGAYGKLSKAPSSLYLNPEQAYFEYININETATTTIPEAERVLMTTTKVFDATNPDLEISKNEKMELGFELNIKQTRLKLTAFKERMNNGYLLGRSTSSFQPFVYNQYQRLNRAEPIYRLASSNNVLAAYNTPTNNRVLNTKGVEFELDLGRFESLRSSFSINGAWTRTENYNKDYFYFDGYSGVAASARTHIGLYEPGMEKVNDQQFVTALRSTHNIPQIGFVVTLTTQVIWNERNWSKFGNDSIPVKYISKNDGQVYNYDLARQDEQEFKDLIRPRNERVYIKESYKPALVFNLNLTKEIADYMRVSFFANNAFRSYPVAASKRSPGTFIERNNRFFCGIELALTLK